MRQTACFVVNPITVNNFSDLRLDGSGIKLSVKLAGAWWSVFGRPHQGSAVGLLLLQRFRVGLLLSTRLVCFISVMTDESIYMFAVLIHWRVEVLHTYWTTSMCIWTTTRPRVRLLSVKPVYPLSPAPHPSPCPSNLLLTVPRQCFLLRFILIVNVHPFSVCLWFTVPMAFHLCSFYFSAILIVGVPFQFGVWGRMWKSIVLVPEHCLLDYFT